MAAYVYSKLPCYSFILFIYQVNYSFNMVNGFMCVCVITSSVTVLLIAAVHAVCIGITPPAERDTVTILTLELVIITLHITAVLQNIHTQNFTILRSIILNANTWVWVLSCKNYLYVCVCTSSDLSAQSWSPSHFHRPAIQRPLVQENSLSEHFLGTDTQTHKQFKHLKSIITFVTFRVISYSKKGCGYYAC